MSKVSPLANMINDYVDFIYCISKELHSELCMSFELLKVNCTFTCSETNTPERNNVSIRVFFFKLFKNWKQFLTPPTNMVWFFFLFLFFFSSLNCHLPSLCSGNYVKGESGCPFPPPPPICKCDNSSTPNGRVPPRKLTGTLENHQKEACHPPLRSMLCNMNYQTWFFLLLNLSTA